MFQKQTFGSNTTAFGAFNSGASTSSPFGSFKPATGGSTFGAPPAFGASTSTQPATGGGLFGSSNTSSGLFGSTTAAAPAPAFGASNSFSFGGNTSGGLFNTSTTGGLFGNTQNANTFAAKPAGFGFGSTAATGTTGGGLFGSTPSASSGLFGQQTNTMASGGLFSNTGSTFGQQTATGTAHAKYNPVVGTDVVVKGGNSQTINIKHHCITCMKEYETKSLEELRLEDYTAGRKGASGGMFGGFQQPADKPLFGGSTFGQPATTSAPSLFGGGLNTTGGFGQTNTFSFGSNTQNNTSTTGLFGAAKPTFGSTTTTGTGLFGATTTQAPTFGTNTSTFGFGSTAPIQSGGLFGSQPATTGFGTSTNTTGFGSFGGGGLFGAKPQQTTAPTFGSSSTPFGSVSTGFGTNTSSSSLFGGSTFGKPTATQQPAFGFNTQPTLGTGLGATNNTFQPRGAAPAFGLGGGSLFQQPQQTNAFGANTSLGGGLFGTTPSLGSSLGMGQLNTNTTAMPGTLQGASGAGVHEQILNLAARPYGDSPLFKDLVPDTSNAKDILRSTNPAAVKAVLDSSSSAAYKVTSPTAPRLRVQPRAPIASTDKKSLFDGLEESDASLEDKLSLKPSRKRLVLRPNHSRSEDNSDLQNTNNNRSLDEQHPRELNGAQEVDVPDAAPKSRQDGNIDCPALKGLNNNSDNHNYDSSDRHGSWLGSQKMPWSQEKEKPIDEPTPRLYPNLDKELPEQISERRASWLTTKPLRKPLVSNPDAVENSVRELGVRTDSSTHDKENIDTLSAGLCGLRGLHFCAHRSGQPSCSPCEKIAHQINGIYVSEEENVSTREAPPHPAGVKLTRPGYYTIPSLDEMTNYLKPDGTCVVPHLTVGRKNYGNVFYDCEIDVAGLDLDALVHFLNKEVIVYPEDSDKPPVGSGLNRRAVVTLDRVWPRDKTERRPITEPDRLLKMDYEGKLRRACDKHDTKFIEYRPQTGSWVFRVEHFSKYGLTDSDEEDEPAPDVLKRQLVNQSLQKAAAPAPKHPAAIPGLASGMSPGLGGLGLGLGGPGLGGLGGLGGPDASDQMFGMQQASMTSLSLMNGGGAKAFEMDTTEDNAESHSLYQDNRGITRAKSAFGVKSPTSELARLEHRQSHNVQLMKASLYADTEMDEDMSTSSADQLVPLAVARSGTVGSQAQARRSTLCASPPAPPDAVPALEAIMRPLIVNPHTIVLKYHRKVPPFKLTIAGRLGAACIADMSVCRARHSRVGFGVGGSVVFATSYDSIADLPKTADLSSLGRYVQGRGDEDWSEMVVARIAIGQQSNNIQDSLPQQLASLLEHSTFSDPPPDLQDAGDWCPRLSVEPSPSRRLRLLQCLMRNAEGIHTTPKYGVSSTYCLEVWKLCDALWGADLENDGMPGTDVQSIVNRHNQLLHWLKEVVSEETDKELARPTSAEEEDESDTHSERVWTLLLGGRVLEACRLCRERGDLNMAAIIAQSGGDPAFRNLLERQLHVWRECGAEALVASHRRAALQLLGGLRAPALLHAAPWTLALAAAARYLCPQVPTLEQVVRTYSSYFSPGSSAEEELDLTTLPPDEADMQYPLPPYADAYRLSMDDDKRRRVLDLRYELIRARAFNTRPKLCPAAYTPDPLDYSLCFLLGCWFGSPPLDSVTGVAEQLERRGDWHLAVQALAYHPNDVARAHLIRSMLSRHAPSRIDNSETKSRVDLLRKLRIPHKWLLLAQAHRAKYEHQPTLEVEYLVGAEQWNAAHKVLIEELLPEAVLADNLQSIRPILDKMSEAAARHEVSGWDTGGQALYHYLYVCDEMAAIARMAGSASGNIGARLEALRPRLAAACLALKGLAPKTPRHAAARAEMGARLVQLALAGGAPPKHLAALLKALQLPPDCTALATQKITTDLAEQASELCIEASSISPSSSHLRATVHS